MIEREEDMLAFAEAAEEMSAQHAARPRARQFGNKGKQKKVTGTGVRPTGRKNEPGADDQQRDCRVVRHFSIWFNISTVVVVVVVFSFAGLSPVRNKVKETHQY